MYKYIPHKTNSCQHVQKKKIADFLELIIVNNSKKIITIT